MFVISVQLQPEFKSTTDEILLGSAGLGSLVSLVSGLILVCLVDVTS